MTSTLVPETAASAPAVHVTQRRVRLEYLDGLRGLAALYVVLHHITLTAVEEHPQALTGPFAWLVYALRQGHLAVAVFIVLSGYVLMLPVAGDPAYRLSGGFISYIKRRARRILPPYYAVLGFSLLAIWTIKGLSVTRGGVWDSAVPVTGWSVLSHLLLVHNLSSGTIFKINYPLWSVATEFQIYFLFPLVLLPLWRRFGATATVALVVAITTLPYAFLSDFRRLEGMCPWFVGLFAMGMAAANANFGRDGAREEGAAARYSLIAALAAGGFAIAMFAMPDIDSTFWLFDTLTGVVTAALIAACTASLQSFEDGVPYRIAGFLHSRFPVAIGRFSYSLYLVHAPIIALIALSLRYRTMTPQVALGTIGGIGLPLILIAAYLFYLLFERPFTNQKAKA